MVHGTTGRNRGSGFTLIEVLVVTALIALLIAILLPSLAAARRQSFRTGCLANQRELGRFTAFFNADHRDQMPRSLHSAAVHGSLEWQWGLAYYRYSTGRPLTYALYQGSGWRQLAAGIYRCPFDRRATMPPGVDVWSYGYNVYFELTATETGDRTWRSATQIPRPAATVLFAEVGDNSKPSMADHVMAHFWTKFDAPPEVAMTRHRPDSAYTFCDGRVQNLPFAQMFDRDGERNRWNPRTAR